jgi:exodeoxyribonuclease VII large subunit
MKTVGCIYSVTEITKNIKDLLEEKFPFIWICGEISNFNVPASGHFYFTLKDENAQISAVMFLGQNQKLKFYPENGMSVTGLGRLAVYEPRGTYQIIFEILEPTGVGQIQKAYEQLKSRLSDEGLFDKEFKTPLPFLPRKISIITSPSGAVVHDILKVAHRRFPDLYIEIVPVKVQGKSAEREIVAAVELLNMKKDSDIAIIARGGGSLEDFHAFNSEYVARAIFKSKIPVISAVGHETDFSISDFVADVRAPTPSAAAEIAIPVKYELDARFSELSIRLTNAVYSWLSGLSVLVNQMSDRLVDPQKQLRNLRIKTDDLTNRLLRAFTEGLSVRRERLKWRVQRLESLSHRKTLARGYSITRNLPDGTVVHSADNVSQGDELEILLEKGNLIVKVLSANYS